MAGQYYIDLEQFSLERFRYALDTGDLLPGRQVLKHEIPAQFAILASMGITNLAGLIDALKTKNRLEQFSRESGLPQDYLVILRREANSYLPKPVPLNKFTGVDAAHVERLAALGIKHSKQLFERARTGEARAALSRLADVPPDGLLELVKLSDLSRVGGVGPVFARYLYEAGVGTLEALAKQSPDELAVRLYAANREAGYTQAMVSPKDLARCIDTAQDLPKAIEY